MVIPNSFVGFIYGIYVLFFLTSCVKEVSYSGNDNPFPVCNAFISPDRGLTVHLSYSANIIGTVSIFDGAVIDVYENGMLIPVDFSEDNGLYCSDFQPVFGKVYSIDVWKDGIKLLSACDTVPGEVIIKNPTWQFPFGMMDEWTTAGLVSFSFSDDQQCKNFYEIMLAHRSYDDVLEYLACMEINNEFVSSNTDRSWEDIKSFVFSDSLFQGKTVEIQIKVQGTSKDNPPFVVLRNVSKSYYQYRRQWTAHQFLQSRERTVDLSFFRGEPINMFSNINGGLGIFVAYSQDIKECRIIQ